MIQKLLYLIVLFGVLGCTERTPLKKTYQEYKNYDNNGLERQDYYDILEAKKRIKGKVK